jgi:hypothetical protein
MFPACRGACGALYTSAGRGLKRPGGATGRAVPPLSRRPPYCHCEERSDAAIPRPWSPQTPPARRIARPRHPGGAAMRAGSGACPRAASRAGSCEAPPLAGRVLIRVDSEGGKGKPQITQNAQIMAAPHGTGPTRWRSWTLSFAFFAVQTRHAAIDRRAAGVHRRAAAQGPSRSPLSRSLNPPPRAGARKYWVPSLGRGCVAAQQRACRHQIGQCRPLCPPCKNGLQQHLRVFVGPPPAQQ